MVVTGELVKAPETKPASNDNYDDYDLDRFPSDDISRVLFWFNQKWFYSDFSIKSCVIGPRSAVGNVSGYRCVSDCNSRGREFDPGPVPYFHGN